MIKAGVIGATGYTGVELLRLLSAHPDVDIEIASSRSEQGRHVCDLFPSLRGAVDLVFSAPDNPQLHECDVVFFATPNGVAMHSTQALLEQGCKVIDLSADFRLKDAQLWSTWYGQEHASPALLEEAVYGLPELNRKAIQEARLVANPGCYPTAVQLGFLPLLEQGLVDARSLIADAKSGVSGAGRNAALASQFCEAGENFKAYAVEGHRHLPEIRQSLMNVSKDDIELVFVPHLTPMIRGIHATLYASLKDTDVNLQQVFEDRYRDEPFVDVLAPGSHPDTASVRGSNTCRIACFRPQDGNTAVILAVEDNLVKGAAGQAIQNMNLVFGLPEATGLNAFAVFP